MNRRNEEERLYLQAEARLEQSVADMRRALEDEAPRTLRPWRSPSTHMSAWGWRGAIVALCIATMVALVTFRGLFSGGEERRGNAAEPRAIAGRVDSGAADRLQQLTGIGLFEVVPARALEVVELESERLLLFTSGILQAEIAPQSPGRPFVIQTPHLRLVIVGTRFDLTVTAEGSTLEVIEGLIRVEIGDGSRLVASGERFRTTELLVAPQLPAALVRDEHETKRRELGVPSRKLSADERRSARFRLCETLAAAREKIRCFEALEEGDDITAQTASFAIALIYRATGNRRAAIEQSTRFERKFRDGFLEPEVAYMKLTLLAEELRSREVVSACASFLEKFSSDPRAPVVRELQQKHDHGRAQPTVPFTKPSGAQ